MDLDEVFFKHSHWSLTQEVVNKLSRAGHDVYIAGGAVRDALLGREVGDFDIATSAKPEEIIGLFDKTIDVGKEFGVIVVVVDGQPIEVATFRKDGDYLDGRHPESVEFSEPKEDALRRDFTINALFYDCKAKKVVDYVDGQKDLSAGVIKAVGDPYHRYDEDKLRMLRAIRFATRFGFSFDKVTEEATLSMIGEVSKVSVERIYAELEKMFVDQNRVQSLHVLERFGFFKEVFSLHIQAEQWSVVKFYFEKSSGLKGLDSSVYWALLSDLFIDQETKVQFFKDLKSPKKNLSLVEKEYLYATLFASGLNNDDLINFAKIDTETRKWLLVLFELKQYEFINELKKRLSEITNERGELLKPLVSGRDLADLGVEPGEEMGKVLKQLYSKQLFEGIKDKDSILKGFTKN